MRSGPKQGFAALQELTNSLGATTGLETKLHALRNLATIKSRAITGRRHELEALRVDVDHSERLVSEFRIRNEKAEWKGKLNGKKLYEKKAQNQYLEHELMNIREHPGTVNLMHDLESFPVQKRAILTNIQYTSHLQEEIVVVDRQARWWKEKALYFERKLEMEVRRFQKTLRTQNFDEAIRMVKLLGSSGLHATLGMQPRVASGSIHGASDGRGARSIHARAHAPLRLVQHDRGEGS
jgi:hypothetical protein